MLDTSGVAIGGRRSSSMALKILETFKAAPRCLFQTIHYAILDAKGEHRSNKPCNALVKNGPFNHCALWLRTPFGSPKRTTNSLRRTAGLRRQLGRRDQLGRCPKAHVTSDRAGRLDCARTGRPLLVWVLHDTTHPCDPAVASKAAPEDVQWKFAILQPFRLARTSSLTVLVDWERSVFSRISGSP